MSHELARVTSFLPRGRSDDPANPAHLNASAINADHMLQDTNVTDRFAINVQHKVNVLRSPAEIQIVGSEDVFAPAEKFFLFRVCKRAALYDFRGQESVIKI